MTVQVKMQYFKSFFVPVSLCHAEIYVSRPKMDVFAQITGKKSMFFWASTVAYQATALPELFLPIFLSIFDGLVSVKEYFLQSPSSYLFQMVTVKVSC